jgi:hypothetical protein
MKSIWQKWQKQVEGLLSEKDLTNPNQEFQHEHNFERLQIPSTEEVSDSQERMIILFSRLSLSYEYGLFFEQLGDSCEYNLLFGFDHGNIFSFENASIVRLPASTPNKVQRLKYTDWFHKWNIKGLAEEKETTHLLLYPWPQTALILSTQLADPWLKINIEKTLDYLRKV